MVDLGIDKIVANVYYVNLDGEKTRNRWMIKQLNKAGLNYIRFEAILGSSINRSLLKNCESLSDGQLGNVFSHFQIYKDFLGSHADLALILEDDTKLPIDLEAILLRLGGMISKEKDIILLNAVFVHPHKLVLIGSLTGKYHLGYFDSMEGGIGSSSAYVITRPAAREMVSIRANNFGFKTDSWTDYWRRGAFDNVYAVFPFPVKLKLFPSTLGYTRNRFKLLRKIPIFAMLAWLNRLRFLLRGRHNLTVVDLAEIHVTSIR